MAEVVEFLEQSLPVWLEPAWATRMLGTEDERAGVHAVTVRRLFFAWGWHRLCVDQDEPVGMRVAEQRLAATLLELVACVEEALDDVEVANEAGHDEADLTVLDQARAAVVAVQVRG